MDDGQNQMADKLSAYYHSEYVSKNQPWILEIKFNEWLNRQMVRIYNTKRG
jgi:hypothetical protein